MIDQLPERLASKVRIDESDCWTWTASRIRGGYGNVGWEGQVRVAHRVIYKLLVGPIPEGLEIDHLCRNRACCNPAHLEPVTHQENVRRGDRWAMGNHERSKTHCPQGHPYDEVNTGHSKKNGSRWCRACARERERLKREKLGFWP
jgi:HNH endonuclease